MVLFNGVGDYQISEGLVELEDQVFIEGVNDSRVWQGFEYFLPLEVLDILVVFLFEKGVVSHLIGNKVKVVLNH